MHKDLRRSKLFLVLLCFLHSYYFRFCLCVPLLAHDMSHLASSPASLSSSSQRLSHTIPSCFHSRGTWNLVALASQVRQGGRNVPGLPSTMSSLIYFHLKELTAPHVAA